MMRDELFYELRIYETVQSRLAGLARQRGEDVPPLFRRHGFDVPLMHFAGVGGPFAPIYGYLLRWTNLDARMRAWGAFYSDPEWIAKMTANYAGEQRVERAHIALMRASPLWAGYRSADGVAAGDLVEGVYELRRHDLSGQDRAKGEAMVGAQLDAMQAAGGQVLGVFETLIGAPVQRLVSVTAWPDVGTLAAYGAAIEPPGPSHDAFLLRPTPYGRARADFSPHPHPDV